VQSDEISIFLHSYKRHDTAAWFDNKVQKMVSVSAGTASSFFSREYYRLYPDSKALPVFDARVFVVPEDDVNNYFLWRQQDWVRNSVQMVASSIYSHSQLHKKNQKDMKEMILAAGQDWEALSPELRIGRTFARTENGFELISGHDFKANPDLIREALKQDESQD
jgi:hypothetical protein